MKKLTAYLDKFKGMQPPDAVIVEAAVSIIREKTGIDISDDDISYSNRTLHVDTSPTTKSRIFMKKEEILEALSKEVEKNTPTDIR